MVFITSKIYIKHHSVTMHVPDNNSKMKPCHNKACTHIFFPLQMSHMNEKQQHQSKYQQAAQATGPPAAYTVIFQSTYTEAEQSQDINTQYEFQHKQQTLTLLKYNSPLKVHSEKNQLIKGSAKVTGRQQQSAAHNRSMYSSNKL